MTPEPTRSVRPEPPAVDAEDPEDARLLAALRNEARRLDPPPPELAVLAASLLSWQDPDAELAALVADSRELAGSVRGAGDDVLLRFEAGSAAITVEASPDGSGCYRLTGQLEPGARGVVRIRRGDAGSAAITVDCDEWGRFEADRLAPGPLSLSWQLPGSGPVQTAWAII